MIIRKIEKKDNLQVEQLIKTIMTEYACVGQGFSIEDAEVKSMFEHYQDPGHIFYVIANEDGKILGCGGIGQLKNADSDHCELKKMYFYSELRGLGYGSKLINMLIDFSKLHYKVIYIETMKNMTDALKLYHKCGFVYLDTGLGKTGHFNCDTFMALKL